MDNPESTDELLVRRLLAAPDLDDAVESLEFWRRRRRRLPWWRFRARREAARMIVRWERLVGTALVSHHREPLEARLAAGVLVARVRLARWTRRVGIAVVAAVTTMLVLVLAPVAALLVLLLHAA